MTSKRSVLITGCSDGGIGSALALGFVQRGFHVFATARNVHSLTKLAGVENATLLPLDVTKPDQINATVDAVRKETGGKLDYLIHNAAQNRFMPILDETIEDAKRLYDINFWGPLQLTQAFASLLMASKGTIVFICSVSGYLNVPWQGVYAASKRSEEIIADNLRLELSPFDVKVISVVTTAVHSKNHTHYENWKLPENSLYSSVKTEFVKRASGNDGAPRMDPHDYAKVVVPKLIAGNTPKFWYGSNSGLVKFLAGWLPSSWMDTGVAKGTGIDVMLKGK